MPKHVVIIPGDDAAPEAMAPTVEILKSLTLDTVFTEFPPGEEGVRRYGSRAAFDQALREAIDHSDSTLFGSTNGTTGGIGYLRWGKQTFANVRPARWRPGFRSPLKNPEGINFVIVRENLEDLYLGIEGDLGILAALPVTSRLTRKPVDITPTGKFALKVITVEVVEATVAEYPALRYEQYIVDDCARRLVASPSEFDVVVMPNLYGDILSDVAAGTLGGLGLAPSGCYGETYAYFESVHGSAPDLAGKNLINPTATLLSAGLMLEYLGQTAAAARLDQAIARVYAEGRALTPDQGGTSSTTAFCAAVQSYL